MKPRRGGDGIDRRGFLGVGALGGAAALTGACAAPAQGPSTDCAAAFDVPAFEFDEATVVDLQKGMTGGELTSRRLTEAYLARIAALDRQGPELRAVIETNPEALAIAGALDAERQAQGVRGPLHGIPVLIKDNIDTADRMTTTAGSLALEGSSPGTRRPRRPAPARGRRGDPRQGQPLRVGQLPLHALDLGLERPRRPLPQPLRPRPQPVRLELGLRRRRLGQPLRRWRSAPRPTARSSARPTPTASSGIKPTVGLVSRAGIIPISHTQDTAGPMARTVADAAALLTALAGVDPRDPATAAAEGHLGRLRHRPGARRAERRPHRRRPEDGRVPPGRRRALRGGPRRAEATGGRDRGSRRRAPPPGARRPRVPGSALRVQGRPQRVLRGPRPECAGEEPRGGHLLQRGAPGARDALLRPGDLPRRRRRRDRSPRRSTSRRWRPAGGCRARRASTRSSTSTVSTPSSLRPAPRPR